MQAMADMVRFIMDRLRVDKCIMIGHSMGGYVTLAFLQDYPERLLAYSLFHSHPLPDSDETKENRRREINLVEEGKKEMIYNINVPRAFADDNLERFTSEIEFAKNIACNTSDKGIINALRGMMLRPDSRELIGSSNLPFLWILGMKDNYINPQQVPEKVILPENGKLVFLNKSGHMGFIEEKDKSLGIIIDFVMVNQPK
jgi:pimeloyl-ACP methyl ester carboxylesterase